jgi:hypothetical protein
MIGEKQTIRRSTFCSDISVYGIDELEDEKNEVQILPGR